MSQENKPGNVRTELSQVYMWLQDEVKRAMNSHASLNSCHEAYGVILEEVEEFWLEVMKKREQRDPARLACELIQIAAMACRAIKDLRLPVPARISNSRETVEEITARDANAGLQKQIDRMRKEADGYSEELNTLYISSVKREKEQQAKITELTQGLARLESVAKNDMDAAKGRYEVLEKELFDLQQWVISNSTIADLGRPFEEHKKDVEALTQYARTSCKQIFDKQTVEQLAIDASDVSKQAQIDNKLNLVHQYIGRSRDMDSGNMQLRDAVYYLLRAVEMIAKG